MNNAQVLWIKVWGIAALQGAITLSWVIYNLYLPILLIQLGLSSKIAIALLIGENALEAVIEPVFGEFSDRQQQFLGSRIPLITLGILLSSVLFIAFPSLIIFDRSKTFSRWLLPLLAVAWASAMAIFRSPAMSLLGRCAPTDQLPQAASILSLVGGLIGAFRFDAYGLILQMGASFAFALGSLSLLVTGAILRWLNPPEVPGIVERKPQAFFKWRLGLIFLTGMLVGWGMRFLVPTVSQILAFQLGSENSKIAMTVFFMVLGLSAIPAGKIGTKLGNSGAMMMGCSILTVSATFLVLVPSPSIKYIAIAFLTIGLSLVLNGAIPYALSLASTAHSGLGVGMYFGGLNAGVSLFGFVFDRLGKTNITTGTFGTLISFVLVLICLYFSQKIFSSDFQKNTQ